MRPEEFILSNHLDQLSPELPKLRPHQRVLEPASLNQVLQTGRKIGSELRLDVINLGADDLVLVSFVGTPASEHLVDDQGEAVHVDRGSVLLALFHLLRRRVNGGPGHLGVGEHGLHDPGGAEV